MGGARAAPRRSAEEEPLPPPAAAPLEVVPGARGAASPSAAGTRAQPAVEPRTLLVAAAIYGGFFALTWLDRRLPWWAVAPLGGPLVAWHGSLQHEVLHGHPTRWRRLNALLAWPPLMLWLPFPVYRDSHLRHHRDAAILTDPVDDPESFYVTAQAWARLGPLGRAALRAHQTLLGRLLLGPPWAVARLAGDELGRLRRGDLGHARAWLLHGAAVAGLLAWVARACAIPIGAYLLCYVYPGVALALLRSFAEHRPAERPAERTVVCEAGWLMSLLFLNNNLHAVHHEEPALAWYDLPARLRATRAALLERNGGYLQAGYVEVARQHLLRPKDPPVHPLRRTRTT